MNIATNVVPLKTSQSSLTPEVMELINETLTKLYETLTTLNKFSVKDISNFNFNDADYNYIDDANETKLSNGWNFWFSYGKKTKSMQVFFTKSESDRTQNICLRFPKRQMRNETTRKKVALWIAENTFSDLGTPEEVNKLLLESVFGEIHNFILYED